MRRARLVLIGDSLGMPREGTSYEKTYVHLLNKALPNWEILARHRRANDSELQQQPDFLDDDITFLRPDALVVHLGIVDCAPRLLSKRQHRWLCRVPNPLRQIFLDFLSRHRRTLTRIFPKVYVKKIDFEVYMRRILKNAGLSAQNIIVLGVSPSNAKNYHRSYGLEENIVLYNQVLEKLCREVGAHFVDLYRHQDIVIDDGIHLNDKGHRVVAEAIVAILSKTGASETL